MEDNIKDLEKQLNEMLRNAEARGYMCGETSGACKVIRMLKLDKEESINLLCNSVGLSRATGTEFYDKYIAEN